MNGVEYDYWWRDDGEGFLSSEQSLFLPVSVIDVETHLTEAGERVTFGPNESQHPLVRKRGVVLHAVLLPLPHRLCVCVQAQPR